MEWNEIIRNNLAWNKARERHKLNIRKSYYLIWFRISERVNGILLLEWNNYIWTETFTDDNEDCWETSFAPWNRQIFAFHLNLTRIFGRQPNPLWERVEWLKNKGWRRESFCGIVDGHHTCLVLFCMRHRRLRLIHNLHRTRRELAWLYSKVAPSSALASRWCGYTFCSCDHSSYLLHADEQQTIIKFYESVNCYFYGREWTWNNGEYDAACERWRNWVLEALFSLSFCK